MQPAQGAQTDQSVLDSINALIGQYGQAPAAPTIPSINYTPPTGTQLDAQYQTFLQQAATNPDIVNYYQGLLNQAQGDYNIAVQYLQQDYQTGVRQTTDTLNANLQQLALTSSQESNTLKDTLNQRGIALTQNPTSGNMSYAGGGEAGSEVSQLQSSQQLRQEAEQRSASQSIENLGLTQQKQDTSAGQQLAQTAQTYKGQEQSDVVNRANESMNIYQQNQQYQQQQAIINQQNQILAKYPG